jgi:hypothetical protein
MLRRVHADRKPPALPSLSRTIFRIALLDRYMPAATVTPGNHSALGYHVPGSHPTFKTAANSSNFSQ